MILFNLVKVQPIGGSKFHGGGKYGEAVFLRMADIFPDEVVAYYDSKHFLNPVIIEKIEQQNIQVVDAERYTEIEAAQKFKADIYSPLTDFHIASCCPDNVLYITTVHGERVLECPTDDNEWMYEDSLIGRLKYYFFNKLIAKKRRQVEINKIRRLVKRDNVKIITVSHHSKFSLMNYCPKLGNDDINVYYSPFDYPTNVDNIKVQHEGKYYLLVSGNRWVKNAYRALQAFDSLIDERPSFKGDIIITGLSQEARLLKSLKHHDRFKAVGYVADAELASLLKGAYLFVYPTLNEGFGYPPLQAMQIGTPVIASAISAVPEVCDNAVMYFNPYSVDEIKMRILAMEDNQVRDRYIQRGIDRFHIVSTLQEKALEEIVNYVVQLSHKS